MGSKLLIELNNPRNKKNTYGAYYVSFGDLFNPLTTCEIEEHQPYFKEDLSRTDRGSYWDNLSITLPITLDLDDKVDKVKWLFLMRHKKSNRLKFDWSYEK